MNRKHSISDYYKIYDKLKEINSNIEFSSDFIIGYPGEEEKDFQDTLQLIKRINSKWCKRNYLTRSKCKRIQL